MWFDHQVMHAVSLAHAQFVLQLTNKYVRMLRLKNLETLNSTMAKNIK